MTTPKNRSVQKGFAILQAFRRPGEWLSAAELSRRAKLPAASGYRLLETLTEIGAVVRGPHGRYRPGMLLVSLSQKVVISDLLKEAAHHVLEELAQQLGQTVNMGLLEHGMVTYIAKYGDDSRLSVTGRIDSQLETYCTALGKVLLAALPAEALDMFFLEGNLVPLTPYTITDPSYLRAELAKVRLRGYAIDDQEIAVGLRCLAVPVRDGDGNTVAAISVSDQMERMEHARQMEVRGALGLASDRISRALFPSAVAAVAASAARRSLSQGER